jgi:diguanylate cyclase (GGDEF)-like protein
MDTGAADIRELHWLLDLVQSIDVGLLVIDRDYRVQVWNRFMANHSGRAPSQVVGQSLFAAFPEIPEAWFRRKAESVRQLKSRAFTTWEQRPYLLRFRTYRPITGSAEHMFQNVTFIPLVRADGEVDYVGVVVYDVTDAALTRHSLEAANRELERIGRTDRLTGLNNRGYWEECLGQEFRRARRTGQTCSLVMFDIDHFKRVNDTWGHQAGDEVIRHVSGTLRRLMRATDIAGRYGGEEFCVILIAAGAAGAQVFAERLRRAVQDSVVTHEDQELRCTISLGIAPLADDLTTHAQWVERADQALYEAKRSGRNRTCLAPA